MPKILLDIIVSSGDAKNILVSLETSAKNLRQRLKEATLEFNNLAKSGTGGKSLIDAARNVDTLNVKLKETQKDVSAVRRLLTTTQASSRLFDVKPVDTYAKELVKLESIIVKFNNLSARQQAGVIGDRALNSVQEYKRFLLDAGVSARRLKQIISDLDFKDRRGLDSLVGQRDLQTTRLQQVNPADSNAVNAIRTNIANLNREILIAKQNLGLINEAPSFERPNQEILELIANLNRVQNEFLQSDGSPATVNRLSEEYRELSVTLAQVSSEQRKLAGSSQTNTTQFASQIGSLNALENEINELVRAYRLLSQVDRQGALGANLIGEINRLTIEANKASIALKEATTVPRSNETIGYLNSLEKEIQDLTQEYKQLTKAQIDAGRGTQIASNISRLRTESERLNRALAPRTTLLDNVRKVFGTTVGATLVFRGINLLTQGISNAAKEVVNFDKQVIILSSILEKSRDDISLLESEAKRLGATTAFTATQVATLQTELAKLGFNQENIAQITPAIIDFSIATGSDVPRAAKLAGAAIKSFDLDLKDTQNTLGTLAISTLRSASTFERLETQLPIVGATANVAGVSLERLTALLGVTADRGIDASIAATSLRNIFIELDKRGLTLEEGLGLINSSANKASTSFDLFGKRGQAVALILAENIDAVNALQLSITGVGASLAELAQKQLTSVSGRVTLLTSAWSGLILAVDDGNGVFSTTFKLFTDLGTDILNLSTVLVNSLNRGFETSNFAAAYIEENARLQGAIRATSNELIRQTTRTEELSDSLIELSEDFDLFGSSGKDVSARLALIGQQFAKLTPDILGNSEELAKFQRTIETYIIGLGKSASEARVLYDQLFNIQINADTDRLKSIPIVLRDANTLIQRELRNFNFDAFNEEELDKAIELGKTLKKRIRDELAFIGLFGDPDDESTARLVEGLNKALKDVTFATAEIFRRSEGASTIGSLFNINDISTIDQATQALGEFTEAYNFLDVSLDDTRRDQAAITRVRDIVRQLNEFISRESLNAEDTDIANKLFPAGSEGNLEDRISKLREALKGLVLLEDRQNQIKLIDELTTSLEKLRSQNQSYIEQLKEIRFLNNAPINEAEAEEFIERRISQDAEARRIIAFNTIADRKLLNAELALIDREANISRIENTLELDLNPAQRNRLKLQLANLRRDLVREQDNIIKLRIDIAAEDISTPIRNFFENSLQQQLERGEINYQEYTQRREDLERGYEQSVLQSQIRLREVFVQNLETELAGFEVLDAEGQKIYDARFDRIQDERKEIQGLVDELIKLGLVDIQADIQIRAGTDQDIINTFAQEQQKRFELFRDRKINELELERELEGLRVSEAITRAQREVDRLKEIKAQSEGDPNFLLAQEIELTNQLILAELKLAEARGNGQKFILETGRQGKLLNQEQQEGLQIMTALATSFFTSIAQGENVFKSFGKLAVGTLLEVIEAQITSAILGQNVAPFPANIVTTTLTLALIRGAIAGLRSSILEEGGILNGDLFAERGVRIKGKKERRGLQVKGNSHTRGGVKFIYANKLHEYEGGETVINKRSSQQFPELLSAINSYKGFGRKFQDGGTLGQIPQLINPSGSDKSIYVEFTKENLNELTSMLKDVNLELVSSLGDKVAVDVAIGLDTENRRKERVNLAERLTTA